MQEKLYETFEKIAKAIYTSILYLSCTLLVIMLCCVIYAVFGRYFFHFSPVCTEEVAVICIIWICMLTASIAIYNESHIRMSIIENIFSQRALKIINKLDYLVILAINILWVIFGVRITQKSGITKLSSSGLPLAIEYISVITSGISGIIITLYRMLSGGKQ